MGSSSARFRAPLVCLVAWLAVLAHRDAAAQELPPPETTWRVDPKLPVVKLDRQYVRPVDGAITIPCGRHEVFEGVTRHVVVNPCPGDATAAALASAIERQSPAPAERRDPVLGAVGIASLVAGGATMIVGMVLISSSSLHEDCAWFAGCTLVEPEHPAEQKVGFLTLMVGGALAIVGLPLTIYGMGRVERAKISGSGLRLMF